MSSRCHMGTPVPTLRGNTTVVAWAHWRPCTQVVLTTGGDVRAEMNLTPAQARQLARELDVAAEVAERETERMRVEFTQ